MTTGATETCQIEEVTVWTVNCPFIEGCGLNGLKRGSTGVMRIAEFQGYGAEGVPSLSECLCGEQTVQSC